jgi:hypothetical protein
MDITNEDRERMARIMMFRPNCPEDWDVPLLDKMIVGEREHGRVWLHQELSAMYTPPRS